MRYFFASIGLFCLAQVLPGARPAPVRPAIPPEKLQAWIADLDSCQFKVRDRASKELRAAGIDGVGPLKQAALQGPSESMDRAIRLLAEMVLSDDLALASTVRLSIKEIADSKSASASAAHAILVGLRQRDQAALESAGARLQFEGAHLVQIDLAGVEKPQAILPLLSSFPELRAISAASRRFGDAEMKDLPALPDLERFDLFESGITDEALKEFKRFPRLSFIPMGKTRVTDAGLKHIAQLTQLRYVGLRGNDVTDAGVQQLQKLTGLTGLNLAETRVTDAGLAHLSGMTQLDWLRINNLDITDRGLEHLKGLKALRFVDLGATRTTAAGRKKLEDDIPGLAVSVAPP